jgi:selenide,water dikinase
MQAPPPIATEIVLLGAGVAHLEVLRRFARRPQPGICLTLVAPAQCTPADGMLPALVRGDGAAADAAIDLAPLAAAANARLILAEPTGLDLAGRWLITSAHPALPFDLLSVDLHGESALPKPCDACIPVSPPSRFLAQLPALDNALPDGARLAIVGGDPDTGRGNGSAGPPHGGHPSAAALGHANGTAAVELALALATRFRGRFRIVLVSEAPEPLADAPLRVRRAARAALVDATVELASAVRAGALTAGRLALSDGSFLAADAVLWAGGTLAPPCLARSGLACDAAGRVQVNAGQRSVSHYCVFAAGDCAARPRDRATGALLFANLCRAARGRRLTRGLRWLLPPAPWVAWAPWVARRSAAES